MKNIWEDGICNTCGSTVYEEGSPTVKDYRNWCSNSECPESKMHYCYDDEFLDYYTHK